MPPESKRLEVVIQIAGKTMNLLELDREAASIHREPLRGYAFLPFLLLFDRTSSDDGRVKATSSLEGKAYSGSPEAGGWV